MVSGKLRFFVYLFAVLFVVSPVFGGVEAIKPVKKEIATLKIGASAPDFDLPGVDGKNHKLSDFSGSNVLAVIFTCNHCPTAQAYEDRIIKLAADYKDKSVAIVAISPNDPKSVSLAELGYSEMSDTLEEMKVRAQVKEFKFPYLYDGDKQEVSKAYGPKVTPHVFIFDKARKLRYVGRVDESERIGTAKQHDTRNAIEALLAGKGVEVETTKTFGCSIKWSGKTGYIKQMEEKWAKEEVTLKTIDVKGMKELMQEKSGKVRLINFWATWCGPCRIEFPELVDTYRMYQGRDFEMITVSLDKPEIKARAQDFLKRQQASTTNYICAVKNPYEIIEVIGKQWQGEIPYTIILNGKGERIYQVGGMINPLYVRHVIVETLGRYYE